jgi:endonuclease-3
VKFGIIYKKLAQIYKNQLCAVDKFKNPFKVLISCIISLRTKDEVTEISSNRLFKYASTPAEMLKLTPDEISKLIYPAGFYKRKGKQIFNISKILIEKYSGEVPDTIEELLTLPGVGRKTANLVLSAGFSKSAICVDTHVHRISNRLGLISTKTPEQTEYELMKILSKRYWKEINHLLVLHGKNTCTPVSPKCSQCILNNHCEKKDVKKSR